MNKAILSIGLAAVVLTVVFIFPEFESPAESGKDEPMAESQVTDGLDPRTKNHAETLADAPVEKVAEKSEEPSPPPQNERPAPGNKIDWNVSRYPIPPAAPKKRKVDEVEDVLGFWLGEWVLKETRTSRNGQSQEGPPARVVGRWKEKGKVIEEKYFVESNGRETQVRVDHQEYDPVRRLYMYRMNPFLFGGGEGVFHSRYDSSSRTFNGELVSPKAPLPNMKLTRMFKQIGRDKFIYKIEVSGGPASGNVIEGSGIRVSTKSQKQISEPDEKSPIGIRGFTPLKKNAQGFLEYTHQKTGIVFVRLPGGQFWMGSPPNETGRWAIEKPHRVSLSPFLIAKYEVTRAQWKKVMGRNPSYPRAELELLSIGDDHPAANIGWTETKRFLETSGLMLPTEAQWEYACRAGSASMFSPSDLNQAGWFRGNAGMKPHPVGKKNPNRFGLYDMHGNVSEMCRDVYDPDFYSKPAASVKDPVNLSGRTSKWPEPRYVNRGGAWGTAKLDCRSAYRRSLHFPDAQYPRIDVNWYTGFRPVYNLR